MKTFKQFLKESKHYEKCLVWKSEEDAAKVKEMATKRDGADLVVDWNVMYFPDKFTFDHIVYHYSVKSAFNRKPEVKLVSELTDKDFHKTA